MTLYDFLVNNYRGAFIIVLTRGGWFDFGEVIDGVGPNIIGLLNAFGTDYVNVDSIDIFF